MADKLVVLTDLGAVKAYRVYRDEMNGSPRIELREAVENPDAHQRMGETLSDQAGRFPTGAGTGQMSHGENHNLRTENEKRLIERLSQQVNEIVRSSDAPYFYFAAPREINQRVVDGFESGVRSKMLKNVGSDLVKVDKSAILSHFE